MLTESEYEKEKAIRKRRGGPPIAPRSNLARVRLDEFKLLFPDGTECQPLRWYDWPNLEARGGNSSTLTTSEKIDRYERDACVLVFDIQANSDITHARMSVQNFEPRKVPEHRIPFDHIRGQRLP
jgi:hypothetical protein